MCRDTVKLQQKLPKILRQLYVECLLNCDKLTI